MILITRPCDAAQEAKRKLEAIGYKTKIFSLLGIEYLNPEIRLDAEYILITSKNAVKALQSIVPNSKKVLVIGKKTAEEVERLGFWVEAVFENSDDLLRKVGKVLTSEEKILYLSGNYISTNLDKALKDMSFDVKRVICYKSNAVDNIPSDLLENVSVIMFYSPRTSGVFASLNKANLENIIAICISYNTAGKVNNIGFKKVITALKPTEEQMITALKYARQN